MTSVLSLDLGTGGVRAGVFDCATARPLAEADASYPTHHPKPAYAEQDPEDWWQAICTAARAVQNAAGNPRIDAICAATTASTVVVAKRSGQPQAPAILWMDARAARESAQTGRVSHPILQASGGECAVEWLVPKAMWTARNQPDLWRRTEVICEALDFVNFRLTGLWVGSLMNATCKWNYDSRNRQFCPDFYAMIGIPELMEKLPTKIVGVGGCIGQVTEDAARALGLNGRPVVVQGGIDAHIGMFGADTIDPGSMLMIGGTSNVHLTNIPDGETAVEGFWGPYPNAVIEGMRLIEGGQVSAGSILNWLSGEIFGLDDDGLGALLSEAGALDPAQTGLLVLDYWMGNRTPYRDPTLRGAILGLSLWHDRAAMYRSCLDAVALGSANVLLDLDRQGIAIERLVVAGGITKNPLWLRATIDAMGKPVDVAENANFTLLGGAVLAAVAGGAFGSLGEAARAFLPPLTHHEPDKPRHSWYHETLERYRETTEILAPVLRRLSNKLESRA